MFFFKKRNWRIGKPTNTHHHLLKHMHLPLKSPHHHPPPILDARLIMTHVALVPEPLVGVGCVDGGIREAEHGRDERMQHKQPKMRLPWRHPILYTVETWERLRAEGTQMGTASTASPVPSKAVTAIRFQGCVCLEIVLPCGLPGKPCGLPGDR